MLLPTEQPRSTSSRGTLVLLLSIAALVGIFTIGVVVGQNMSLSSPLFGSTTQTQSAVGLKNVGEENVDFSIFWRVWHLMNEKHVQGPFDQKKLMYGAIKGMVDSAGDSHSSYWDVEETKEFSNWVNNSFYGIGVEIEKKKDTLVILNVLEGTPAKTAGLASGDVIVMIGKDSTMTMSLNEAVIRIRGEKGSTVSLTVIRNGQELTMEVTRDIIKVDSVRWHSEGDIAYVQVLHFGDDTITGFSKAVDEILPTNPKGLVLDLRNNGGGFLDAAEYMSGVFFKDGIVMQEDKKGDKKTITVEQEGKLSSIPVAVLVNKYSASASEIVAGAIQDRKRGILIGETSFGKGTIQNVESLPDGSSLRITIAYWLTPTGRNVNGIGLTPDVVVPFNKDSDKDEQLQKALELVQTQGDTAL